MNKKSKAYIFLFLCLLSLPSTHIRPFVGNIDSSLSQFSLHNFQHIITEYPKLSLIIAAFISILSCTKMLYSLNAKDVDHRTRSKAEIVYNKEQSSTTLKIYSHNVEKPLCYNNPHSYEISPQGNYILARQLNETSIFFALRQTLFCQLGVYSTIHNLLRSSSVYHIIDVATGNIILTLDKAQQCFFSKNEKLLLVREATSTGILAKVARLLSFFKKTEPLKEQKDFSVIQYRVIDLNTKKTIHIFHSISSARFIEDETLEVIHTTGKRHYLIPEQYATSFSNSTRLKKIQHTSLSLSPVITFYFDNSKQTYCLDVETIDKPFDHVKTYHQHDNFLLINTDPHEHQELQLLSTQEITFTSLFETIKNIILILQKPQYNSQLIDLSSGQEIDSTLFHYINPIVCSFTQDNTVCIAELDTQKNRILYKQFNLTHKNTSTYKEGKAITFNADNQYVVVDEHNNTCQLKNKTLLSIIGENIENKTTQLQQELHELGKQAEQTAQNINNQAQVLFEHIQAAFTPHTQSCQLPLEPLPIDQQKPYSLHPFYKKITPRCAQSKTNFLTLLQQGVHGFDWNIHIFNRRRFETGCNILEGYVFPNEHICISHLPPENMKHTTYQSLTNELEKIIKHMISNKHDIVSIFLTVNECPAKTIDQEITQTLLKYPKNNPLLTQHYLKENQKTLETLTIAEMITANKRLLFFCDKDDTQTTHPLLCASKHIYDIS